ncbi:FAD-binding protein [Pendulispora albinea]|uniref:FAD-binding protein n=1 Tax=Pendulispora albinea TaxID=2741071 RepID=A0ABZ2MA83_9BACT
MTTSPDFTTLPALDGALVTNEGGCQPYADDFGHIVRALPRAVLRPGSVADILTITRFAAEHGLPLTARGAGHSLHGQSQVASGIVIDMTTLATIHRVSADRVVVDAGALWSRVLDATLSHGLTPPVLTDYLETTVGGTLSAGGIGGMSHRHGLQVDQIASCDVVIGDGTMVRCSPEENRALFDAVRAGHGRCGIMVSATLALVPAYAHARVYRFTYSDLREFLADQRRLVVERRADYVEGFITPGASNGWGFVLEAARFTDSVAELDDMGLHGTPDVKDMPYRDFAHRVRLAEDLFRSTGEWHCPHPWWNAFIPESATPKIVTEALGQLTPADLGGKSGLILLYPFRTEHLTAPLLRSPDEPIAYLFAVLPTAAGDSPVSLDRMLDTNLRLYDLIRVHNGAMYPIGNLPFTTAQWQAHYGPQWETCQRNKIIYDPHGIFGSR